MQILLMIGAILAVLVGIVLLCLGVLWLQKRFPSKSYDERQKIARANASTLAVIVGYLYFLAVAIVLINQVEGPKTVEPYLLVMIGIMLMAMVDHTYCLLCHAALPFSQKGIYSIACYLFCGVLHLINFFVVMRAREISLVGTGTSRLFSLLLGIGFLYLALMHTIALLRDRKNANE